MDPTWSQDGFLLKRCHNLFEIVWNLDPCPVRNRNPEWAQLSASYLLCWGWIRLSFCHVSSGIGRFCKPVLQPLKELKQREKPTNKKPQYPTIVTTSVSRACRSHTFLGGLLHNSVVLVGGWSRSIAIAGLCVRPSPEPRYVAHASTKKTCGFKLQKKTPNPLVYRHLHPPSLLKWPTKWAIPSSCVTYPWWYPNRNCPLRIKKSQGTQRLPVVWISGETSESEGRWLGDLGIIECKPLTSYPATQTKQYDAAISNLRCPAN